MKKSIALLLAVCVLTFQGSMLAPPPAAAETVTPPTSRPLATPSDRRDISRIPGASAGDQQKVKVSTYGAARLTQDCRRVADARVLVCTPEADCPIRSMERVRLDGVMQDCPVTCSGEPFDTGAGLACDCEFETSDCVPSR